MDCPLRKNLKTQKIDDLMWNFFSNQNMTKKQDLIKEAERLGIEVSPKDTISTLNRKIEDHNAENAPDLESEGNGRVRSPVSRRRTKNLFGNGPRIPAVRQVSTKTPGGAKRVAEKALVEKVTEKVPVEKVAEKAPVEEVTEKVPVEEVAEKAPVVKDKRAARKEFARYGPFPPFPKYRKKPKIEKDQNYGTFTVLMEGLDETKVTLTIESKQKVNMDYFQDTITMIKRYARSGEFFKNEILIFHDKEDDLRSKTYDIDIPQRKEYLDRYYDGDLYLYDDCVEDSVNFIFHGYSETILPARIPSEVGVRKIKVYSTNGGTSFKLTIKIIFPKYFRTQRQKQCVNISTYYKEISEDELEEVCNMKGFYKNNTKKKLCFSEGCGDDQPRNAFLQKNATTLEEFLVMPSFLTKNV